MSRASRCAGSCATAAATRPFARAAKRWRRTGIASWRWRSARARHARAPPALGRWRVQTACALAALASLWTRRWAAEAWHERTLVHGTGDDGPQLWALTAG